MSENPEGEDRYSSDSSDVPLVPSSSRDEEREEEGTWESSLQCSLIVLSDASVRIMQEDFETNLERTFDALKSMTNMAVEARQLKLQPLPQLQQIKLQLRKYLTNCKEYAGACQALGEYLSSREFTDGLKEAVQLERIRDITTYLDNVSDSLQTCIRYSTEIELNYPAISRVLNEAMAATDQSLLTRRRRASQGIAGAGVSTTAITAAVAGVGFFLDPIFTGPIALTVVGGGLLVAGIATLPFTVRYVRMRRQENQVLKNIDEELENLALGIQATNELIGGLRGSVEQHSNHLRLLYRAKQEKTAPDTDPSKDYIYRQIDSLQTAMTKMAQKATNISQMELPPQLVRTSSSTNSV